MLDTTPVFDPGLGQNQNLVAVNSNSNIGLEPFNPPGLPVAQHSSFLFTLSVDSASFRGSQLHDGINGNELVLRGNSGSDSLKDSVGNDTLYGLAGNDWLTGCKGDDLLNGGTGSDWLVKGKGNDVLIDYNGGDQMTGGKGADQFWLSSWDSPDTPSAIIDFQVGTDVIKVGRLGATFDNLTIQDSEKGATISD